MDKMEDKAVEKGLKDGMKGRGRREGKAGKTYWWSTHSQKQKTVQMDEFTKNSNNGSEIQTTVKKFA